MARRFEAAGEPPAPEARVVQTHAGGTGVSRRRLVTDLVLGAAAAAGATLFGRQPDPARAGTDGDWTLSGNTVADEARWLGTRNAHRLTVRTNNVARMTVLADGRIGVGTTAPTSKFQVAALGPSGLRSDSGSALASAYAVHGRLTSTSAAASAAAVRGSAVSEAATGVAGRSTGNSGTGVSGEAPNSISTALGAGGVRGVGTVGVLGSGEYMGVQGTSLNYGVFGYTNPDTGGIGAYGRGAVGVKGRSYVGQAVLGDTDTGVGVKGEAYGDGGAVKAIHGEAFGAAANGVVGEANNGAAAYGVWGKSSSGYAGVFSGKATVTGTLSKGGGSFRIDHPLDPANKYLSHSFVESPDMMNVYNGNVTTDGRGRATVKLPPYFDVLNRDFRYQLTTIGQMSHAWISKEIVRGTFSIRTDRPDTRVSWQVTGIRKDPFADANRIVVEEDKPAHERGTYLHPKLHGKPASLAFDYDHGSAGRRAVARSDDPRP